MKKIIILALIFASCTKEKTEHCMKLVTHTVNKNTGVDVTDTTYNFNCNYKYDRVHLAPIVINDSITKWFEVKQ